MPKPLKLTGHRFGRLRVLKFHHIDKSTFWLCRCRCGKKLIASANHLRAGTVKSCGCLHRDAVSTHGHMKGYRATPEYDAWKSARGRCRCKTHKYYNYYGGRGITVCKRWDRFEHFLADMGKRPSSKLTLERRNNDRGYCPSNCYWATRSQQNRNRRCRSLAELTR